jgi:signal transduction histidine kinase
MQLGGYHELRLLHRGQRHLVFRGRSLHDDRPVVVKTVEPGAPATALRHEHALLATLDLDGVPRPLALRWLGETPALVLPDAGPHNLREWLRRRPLEPRAFFPLAIDLTAILAALHARGVIHRDVNPSNIVVGADGQTVTLVDFDVATSAGVPEEGRPPSLAPEQTGLTGSAVDHRADLYALGATFYEMLIGAPPFSAGDPGELMHAHLARAPVAPCAVNPALPRALSDLVLRLLAKSPDERHPSARALLADLEESRRPGSVAASAPEPPSFAGEGSGDPARVLAPFHRGVPLPRIQAVLQPALLLAERRGDRAAVDQLRAYRQAVRCLQGQTASRFGFDGPDFDEPAYLAAIAGDPRARFLYQTLRLHTSFLFQDLPRALAAAEAADAQAPTVTDVLPRVEHNLLTSLALLASAETATPELRVRHLARIAANQQQLRVWAEEDQNLLHKHLLVAAELARLEERPDEAASLYDQAIDGARRCDHRPDEALANELAGRFFRGRARRRIARLYLRAALDAYTRWGATAKVAALEEEHPDLVNLELAEPGPGGPRSLDLLGLLKAAETISSEVVLERLLEKLLAVCLEVAGATRGALALDEEGTLVVQAAGAAGEPVSLARTPLADASELPGKLLQLVHEGEDPLVLAAAARSSPVAEPIFAARGTRSVLLLPIRQRARPVGVLYLENHLVENAFSAERVRVLQLLSSQVAISVENARLYRQAQESIRQREEFLSVASHELQTPLAALQLAVHGILHGLEPASGSRLERAGRVAARQAERLSALIDELLDLSRIRSGHLTMHLEPVDLAAVVRAISDRFESQVEEAGCLVRLRLPGPAVGRWDRRRLEQVVTNLLSNAVKFGRGHPIDLQVNNTTSGSTLAVTDRGVGIPAERIGRLFQRFERGASSSSSGGLGLGLYITREIVTGLGGTVSAESEPGAGATFTVELPRSGPP